MQLIIRHYPDTLNGVIVDNVVRGGTFMPEGVGEVVTTLEFEVSGKARFDPDTGDAVVSTLAEWQGVNCSASVIERADRDRRGGSKGYIWISATDRDKVVHTVEFPVDGEPAVFGYLSADVVG